MKDNENTTSIETELNDLLSLAQGKVDSLTLQTEKENDLKKSMQLRFKQNLESFEHYFPDLAKKFKYYNPESFSIVCAPSGDANLLDKSSGLPFYGDDPRAHCKEQVNNRMDKPQFTSLSFSQYEDMEIDFLHTVYLDRIYNIYLEAKEKLEPLNTVPEHLGSAIIFGVGLGYHLEYIFEQTMVDTIYVVEPDNDVFYASLYTCNWTQVLKKIDENDGEINLNIGVDYKHFFDDFTNAMRHRGMFNSVNTWLYQHYPSIELSHLIDEFRNNFHVLSTGWGFFDDGILALNHDYHNLKRNTPFLKKHAEVPAKARSMPVYLVGNGPSLDEAIDLIRENQEQVIIISCGSAINPLLKTGIIPDFHVSMERTSVTYEYFEHFVDLDALKKINFLTLNTMYPKVADLFKWTGMAFKPIEPSTCMYVDYIDKNTHFKNLVMSTPMVSNAALSYSLYMGFDNIYLFGIDCGYKDPKYHHSKDSLYYNDDGEEKDKLGKVIRTGEIVVEGNFEPEVYSTVFMDTAKRHLEGLIEHFKRADVHNCSDGAKIKGAYPLRPDMVLMEPVAMSKHDLLDYIRDEMFMPRPFDEEEYIRYMDYDGFNQIVDEMIAFVNKRFDSRAEAADALRQQIRVLFSVAHTYQRHIYMCLEGTMVYVQSVFRLIMYGFKDEQKMLDVLKDATDLYIEFMEKAKLKYANTFTKDHNVNSYLTDLFNEK